MAEGKDSKRPRSKKIAPAGKKTPHLRGRERAQNSGRAQSGRRAQSSRRQPTKGRNTAILKPRNGQKSRRNDIASALMPQLEKKSRQNKKAAPVQNSRSRSRNEQSAFSRMKNNWAESSQRQKWVLRLLLLLGAILAVFLVIHTIRGAVASMQENRTQPNVAENFAPVPCSAAMLDTTVAHNAPAAGEPVSFTITLKNSAGQKACYIDMGYANAELRLWSGNQTIWDSQKCQAGEEKRILLLDKGLSTTHTLYWNGHATDAGCADLYPAKSGTYKMQLYIGGEKAGGENSFFLGGFGGSANEDNASENNTGGAGNADDASGTGDASSSAGGGVDNSAPAADGTPQD